MVFEKGEYQARLAKCREAMALKGIEVLIEPDPANMNYLTGYDGWSFYVPQVVVVSLDHDDPIWIGRGVDIGGARATTFLPDDRIDSYPDYLVDNVSEHPMDFIGAELARRGLGDKTIALERDCYYFTPRCRDALVKALPNAKFVEAGRLVNWLRLVKSQAELTIMSEAARIAEKLVDKFFEVVEPGVRECDAIAQIYRTQVEGTADFGGDYSAIVPMMPTGAGTSAAHLTWTDQRFPSNELAFLETAGVRHRYHIPVVRTLHLGPPPQRLLDTSEAVIEGIEVAVAAAKTGATGAQVEAAWRDVILRYGMVKESRIGYSIGIGYPPDWGEHTVSLRPGENTELRSNMTFHMVCGMWHDDWGLVISESFRVSDRGGVPFISSPRGLHVKV